MRKLILMMVLLTFPAVAHEYECYKSEELNSLAAKDFPIRVFIAESETLKVRGLIEVRMSPANDWLQILHLENSQSCIMDSGTGMKLNRQNMQYRKS